MPLTAEDKARERTERLRENLRRVNNILFININVGVESAITYEEEPC